MKIFCPIDSFFEFVLKYFHRLSQVESCRSRILKNDILIFFYIFPYSEIYLTRIF